VDNRSAALNRQTYTLDYDLNHRSGTLGFSGQVKFDPIAIEPEQIIEVIQTSLAETLMTQDMILSMQWVFPLNDDEEVPEH
jgi:hypothetical protein